MSNWTHIGGGTLALHCGATAATREDLAALPMPVPMGPRHQPVHHFELVEAVANSLHERGWSIGEEAFGLTANGDSMFGLMELKHDDVPGFEGGGHLLGLAGNHAQRRPINVGGGSRMFCCDNLAFSGTVVMKTKQTTHVYDRLPLLVADLLDQIGVEFMDNAVRFKGYRAATINDTLAHAAITEMGAQGIINWGELGKVYAEWHEPSHEEFVEDGKSIFRLFNAATEVMKLRNVDHPRVVRTMDMGPKLHELMDEVALAA